MRCISRTAAACAPRSRLLSQERRRARARGRCTQEKQVAEHARMLSEKAAEVAKVRGGLGGGGWGLGKAGTGARVQGRAGALWASAAPTTFATPPLPYVHTCSHARARALTRGAQSGWAGFRSLYSSVATSVEQVAKNQGYNIDLGAGKGASTSGSGGDYGEGGRQRGGAAACARSCCCCCGACLGAHVAAMPHTRRQSWLRAAVLQR